MGKHSADGRSGPGRRGGQAEQGRQGSVLDLQLRLDSIEQTARGRGILQPGHGEKVGDGAPPCIFSWSLGQLKEAWNVECGRDGQSDSSGEKQKRCPSNALIASHNFPGHRNFAWIFEPN